MKRIDWKFAVIVTVFVMFWSMTIWSPPESLQMPYGMAGSTYTSIASLVSGSFRTVPTALVLVLITSALLVAFSYVLSEIWNRLIRMMFPKLVDLRLAEVYVLLLILPILIGYLF